MSQEEMNRIRQELQELERDLADLRQKADEVDLHARLMKLTESYTRIKSALSGQEKESEALEDLQRAKKVGGFVLENWAVVLSLLGLLVIIYVYVHYDVSYFENFQNTYTIKQTSEHSRELGDRLIGYGEFKAAGELYNTALKFNPYNARASQGILITDIMTPPEGKKYSDPAFFVPKLNYLDGKFPNDYRITYLKGRAELSNSKWCEARKLFIRSITQARASQTTFNAGYVGVAYVDMRYAFQFGEACQNLEQAVRLDEDDHLAQLNLGYCYYVSEDFDKATEHLLRSLQLGQRLTAAICLADAYLLNSDYDNANAYYSFANYLLTNSKADKDYLFYEESIYHFLPTPDKKEAYRLVEVDNSPAQNKLFLDYELAINHAVQQNKESDGSKTEPELEQADKEFKQASTNDSGKAYICFFANKISYILASNKLKIKDNVRTHLSLYLNQLIRECQQEPLSLPSPCIGDDKS